MNNFSVAVEGGASTHFNLFFCEVQLKLWCPQGRELERGPTPLQLVQCSNVIDAVHMDLILPVDLLQVIYIGNEMVAKTVALF